MYRQIVTHNRRAAILILVDCSLSMLQPNYIGALNRSKMEVVEITCNMMIDELVERATRHGFVRNYYDIAVIGYSHDEVRSLLRGDSEGFVPVNKLVDMAPMPKTTTVHNIPFPDGIRDINITYRPWIEPRAGGATPMCEALAYAYSLVDAWCRDLDNRDCFPPIVINITDGVGNDSNTAALMDISERITKTNTTDGNTLFFNVLLTSNPIDQRVALPHRSKYRSTNRDAMTLFKMSSLIPKCLEGEMAYLMELNHRGPYRGFMMDFAPVDLMSLLNSGTESRHRIRQM